MVHGGGASSASALGASHNAVTQAGGRRPRDDLSIDEARRLAIAAQGLAEPRPRGRIDARHLRKVFDRVGVIQIDSVNVLARSHYLPPFSRLGPYRSGFLDELTHSRREVFEYWGHEASLVPVEMHPLFRWRMQREEPWRSMRRLLTERPDYVESVFREVEERGPIGASELADPGERAGPWWGWAAGKDALEWLYWTGRLAIGGRRNFERLYDLPERVIPRHVLNAPTPHQEEAHRELLRVAARALGVATVADLADYFRIGARDAAPRVEELVEEGDLVPVKVKGWKQPAFRWSAAGQPRRVDARTLLTPFDSLVWFRARTERLFGFRYRIEIYVPAPKRQFGYYVLPFLLGERLVGRIDLKADRKASALLVQAAHAEDGVDPVWAAEHLTLELEAMRSWMGLDRIQVTRRGNLAPALASHGRTRPRPR